MRLFVASLRRLIRRPASLITLSLLIGLLALIFLAVGATANQVQDVSGQGRAAAILLLTFPGAYVTIIAFILGLGGLFAVIYGAAIAGSEWSWGTLKSAVARGESRSRYQLALFGSVALLLGIGLLVAFAAGVVVAILGGVIAGFPISGLDDSAALGRLPDQIARGWLAVVEQGALGFAIATLARSQLAGIGAGIAFYFAEGFASLFLPDIVKYLPFDAAGAMVATPGGDQGFGGGPGGGPGVSGLDPDTALIVVVAWLIGSLAVAATFTERAEITG